jgi:hypothetical protein
MCSLTIAFILCLLCCSKPQTVFNSLLKNYSIKISSERGGKDINSLNFGTDEG